MGINGVINDDKGDAFVFFTIDFLFYLFIWICGGGIH